MLLSIFLLFLQFLFGSLVFGFIDKEKKLNTYEAVIARFVVGLVASGFLLLAILLLTASWHLSLYVFWATLFVTGIYQLLAQYRDYTGNAVSVTFPGLFQYFRNINTGLFLSLIIYLLVLTGVLWVRDNNILVAVYAAWGDTAYHLDMISRLRYSDPFILTHPVLAGEKLTYPFLVNLLSALYQRTGAGVLFSWHLPVLVFGVSFVLLTYSFGKRIFHGSRSSALALVLLLLYGSGTGFIWYFHDINNALHEGGPGKMLSTAVNPPGTYTNLDVEDTENTVLWPVNIKWIVPAIGFFSHQKSFIPGIALAFLLFLGVRATRGSPRLWRWGIVWGMLPLVHAHTFIAVSIVLFCWFLTDLRHWRRWILSGTTAAILALPQLFILVPDILLSSGKSSFIRLSSGWVACKTTAEWLSCIPTVAVFESVSGWLVWFWTANFGIVFWVWLVSLITLPVILHFRDNRSCVPLYEYILPGILLFVIPNLVLFQPWDFDNNKILFYWWIFASVLSIYFFKVLTSGGKLYGFLLILFVFLSSLSGFIEIMNRFAEIKTGYYNYYQQHQLDAAEWIKDNTEPNDVFLTGDQPTQYIPMLTGRPIYLGYHGWLWSQGRDDIAKNRFRAARTYLSTGYPGEICDDGVKFLLWDESLLATYPDSDYDRIKHSTRELYTQGKNEKLIRILNIECKN